jgi:predicted dehydrogenase
MKVAVIGCGSIGRRHIGNLLTMGYEVVASNRGQERRDQAAQDFKIRVYRDMDEMLDHNIVEAVIICSPNSFHLEHTTKAIKKGLHIFVEKPIAVTLDGLDELELKAAKKDLIIHVGANMRFHFGPSTVKEYIDSGQLGRPLWAHFWGGMHLPDWHPEEDYRQMYSAREELGGGAVLDFIHEIDLIRWMFGDPERLAAIVGKSGWLELETEDVVDVVMGYKQGMQINLHLDYIQRPFQRGIRVVGDRGWIQWDLAQQTLEWFEHDTQEKYTIPYPNGYDHNDMYIAQMKYFFHCIEINANSSSGISAGRNALELALNIKQSALSNKFIKT